MDEDMDAPEEVTLTEGKQEANDLRKTERENQIRVAAEAKKRRKQQAMKKEERQMNLEKITEPTRLSKEQQETAEENSDPASAGDYLSLRNPKKDGMLPDSIVNFLAGREKQAQLSLTETDEKRAASTLKPKKKKMKTKDRSNAKNRVQVVVLGDVSSSERVQNAKKFLQDRQSRVHRSTSMLKHFKEFPFLAKNKRSR